jgi:probable F420-dependent oxidoreductase
MRAEAVLGLWQDRPPGEAIATAVIAEELSYERLWIGEMATYDAFALATSVATATSRIEPVVGPLAVAVRSAVGIAVGVASVTALTGRRCHVALGTSSTVVVERWHGRSRTGGPGALAAGATSIRTLLAGERDPVSGFRLRLDPVDAELHIAAFGPRAVGVAAAQADRMLLNMVTPQAVKESRRQLDDAGGRHIGLAAWLVSAVDPGPEEVAQIKMAAVGYLSAPGYREMFTDAGFGEPVELARRGVHPREVLAAIPEGFERAVGLVGTRQEIATLVNDYRNAGLETICVIPVTAAGDLGRKALQTLRDVIDSSEGD